MQEEQDTWNQKNEPDEKFEIFLGKLVSDLIPITFFLLLFALVFEAFIQGGSEYLEARREEKLKQQRLELERLRIEKIIAEWEENSQKIIAEIESHLASFQFRQADYKIKWYERHIDDPRLNALQEKMPPGAIRIEKRWNPATTASYIRLRNQSEIEGEASDGEETQLLIECQKGKIQVAVETNRELANREFPKIFYTLEADSPREDHISIDHDDNSLLLWSPDKPSFDLVREMAQQPQMTVLFTDKEGQYKTSFDLEGLSEFLPALEKACGETSSAGQQRMSEKADVKSQLVALLSDSDPSVRRQVFEKVMQDEDQNLHLFAIKELLAGDDKQLRFTALQILFSELEELQITVSLPENPSSTQNWLHQRWEGLDLSEIASDEVTKALSGKFETATVKHSKNRFEGLLNLDGMSLKLLRGKLANAHICELKTDMVGRNNLSGQLECKLNKSVVEKIAGGTSRASLPVTVNLPEHW